MRQIDLWLSVFVCPPGGKDAGFTSDQGRSSFICLRDGSDEDIRPGTELEDWLDEHLPAFLVANTVAMDLFKSKHAKSGSIRALIGFVSYAQRAKLLAGFSAISSASANAGATLAAAGPGVDTDASCGETESVGTNKEEVVGVCLRVCSVEVRKGKDIAVLRQFPIQRWDGTSMTKLREELQWAFVAEGRRLFAGVLSRSGNISRYAIPEDVEMVGAPF